MEALLGNHIAHTALPVREWPALGMPWATARSNTASAVCSRFGGAACAGGCGRAGQVVCGGCGFAGLWRFPEEEVALTTNMQRVNIVRSAFSAKKCRPVFVVRGQINADTLVCIFYSLCMHSAKYENVNQNDQKISSC